MIQVGTFIDNRYELRRPLGEGGMGQVFLAYDSVLRREVALKLLPPAWQHDPAYHRWLENEAHLIANLQHPAIVRLHNMGEHGGQPYLDMQYLAGGPLSHRLDDGPLAPAVAAAILERLAAALDFAHRQGIIHLDIKPSNILFDENDEAYLSDFGIARSVNGVEADSVAANGQGTPAYKAPEQWRHEPISPRTDIYQLGAVLYQMLTGQRPFDGEGETLRRQHLQASPPSLRQTQPGLGRTCDPVIRRALAKAPADRYASAGELAADFRARVDRRPRHLTGAPPTQPTTSTAESAVQPASPTTTDQPWTASWAAGSAAAWGVATAVAGAVLLLAAPASPGLATTLLGSVAGGARGAFLVMLLAIVLSAGIGGGLGGALGGVVTGLTARLALPARLPAGTARRASLAWGVLLTLGLVYSYGGILAGLAEAVPDARAGLVSAFLGRTFLFGCLLPATGAAVITLRQLHQQTGEVSPARLAVVLPGWLLGAACAWAVAGSIMLLATIFVAFGSLAVLFSM